MKNKQIQEFFTKVAQDESFKAEVLKLKKEMEAKKLNEQDVQKFVKEKLLPKAKKLGYDFSEKDLADFGNSQEMANLTELSPEELENVSGGFGPIAIGVVSALGAFLTFVGGLFANRELEPRVNAAVKEAVAQAEEKKEAEELVVEEESNSESEEEEKSDSDEDAVVAPAAVNADGAPKDDEQLMEKVLAIIMDYDEKVYRLDKQICDKKDIVKNYKIECQGYKKEDVEEKIEEALDNEERAGEAVDKDSDLNDVCEYLRDAMVRWKEAQSTCDVLIWSTKLQLRYLTESKELLNKQLEIVTQKLAQLDSIEATDDELKQQILNQIEELHQKRDNINEDIDGVNKKIDKVQERLKDANEKIVQIETSIQRVKDNIQYYERKFEESLQQLTLMDIYEEEINRLNVNIQSIHESLPIINECEGNNYEKEAQSIERLAEENELDANKYENKAQSFKQDPIEFKVSRKLAKEFWENCYKCYSKARAIWEEALSYWSDIDSDDVIEKLGEKRKLLIKQQQIIYKSRAYLANFAQLKTPNEEPKQEISDKLEQNKEKLENLNDAIKTVDAQIKMGAEYYEARFQEAIKRIKEVELPRVEKALKFAWDKQWGLR